jgi:Tfp pilus assembly protein PilO|tara:strand:+ start:139 stop:390 length:252 start_codon:yes stop_codon:yes gene_type:complete
MISKIIFSLSIFSIVLALGFIGYFTYKIDKIEDNIYRIENAYLKYILEHRETLDDYDLFLTDLDTRTQYLNRLMQKIITEIPK